MNHAPATTDPRLDGIPYRVSRHGRVSSMAEAASLRGVLVEEMVKTMVVKRPEGSYLFVLVPGDRVIDWQKLRSHLGERRLSMPDAEEARSATGYERGTITPFGAREPFPVIADPSIATRTVSIGAGAPGVSLSLAGADVVRVLDAELCEVTKPVDQEA